MIPGKRIRDLLIPISELTYDDLRLMFNTYGAIKYIKENIVSSIYLVRGYKEGKGGMRLGDQTLSIVGQLQILLEKQKKMERDYIFMMRAPQAPTDLIRNKKVFEQKLDIYESRLTSDWPLITQDERMEELLLESIRNMDHGLRHIETFLDRWFNV